MKYRAFRVPVSGGEPEEELNHFLSSHRVAGIEKHFVSDGQNSFWAFSLSYQEGGVAEPSSRRGRVDYRETLDEEEFGVFAELRNLRKQLSDREGVPPYALFTNEQLARMIRQRVRTKEALGSIAGIGPARVEKYGEAFLEVLSGLSDPPRGGSEP